LRTRTVRRHERDEKAWQQDDDRRRLDQEAARRMIDIELEQVLKDTFPVSDARKITN
jgi:hypothetical protein